MNAESHPENYDYKKDGLATKTNSMAKQRIALKSEIFNYIRDKINYVTL